MKLNVEPIRLDAPYNTTGYVIVNGERIWCKLGMLKRWHTVKSPKLIAALDHLFPQPLVSISQNGAQEVNGAANDTSASKGNSNAS